MSVYQFQFEDFALSDNGIHLSRNQFNFKTIGYDQIDSAIVDRTSEIKNGPLVMIFGLAMVCFAFYQSRWVIQLFNDPNIHRIYIESILLLIIPAGLGIYCIYSALKKGPVLILNEGGIKHRLRLRTAIKKGLAYDFEKYLSKQLANKMIIAKPII